MNLYVFQFCSPPGVFSRLPQVTLQRARIGDGASRWMWTRFQSREPRGFTSECERAQLSLGPRKTKRIAGSDVEGELYTV